MKKDFIEKMKKTLLDNKAQITNAINGHNEQVKDMADGKMSGDVVDIASDTIDWVLMDSMGTQNEQNIQMIDNALDRIERGTYGICLRCNQPIAEARLEAIPHAAFCIACQAAIEKENR